MLRIVPDVGMEACRKLWRETTEKRRKGELAEPDSVKVLDLLKARMEALEGAPQERGAARSPCPPLLPPPPVLTRVRDLRADSLSGAGSGRHGG